MRFTLLIAACITIVLIAAGCSGNDSVLSSSSSGMSGDLSGRVVLREGSNDEVGDNGGVTFR